MVKRFLLLLACLALPALAECTNKAAITVSSATGSTQIIAAPLAGRQVKICALVFSSASSITVKVVQGTGTNCAANTADVTGPVAPAINWDLNISPLRASPSRAVCLNFSGSTTGGGFVIWTQ